MSKYDVKVNISTSILVCFKKKILSLLLEVVWKNTQNGKKVVRKNTSNYKKVVRKNFLIRYKGLCTPVEVKAVSGNAKSLKNSHESSRKVSCQSGNKVGGL